MQKIMLVLVLVVGVNVSAQQVISVSPFQSANFHDVAFEPPVGDGTSNLVMDFAIKCFAPNLRNVPGPLAPDAEVTMEIGVHPQSNRDSLVMLTVNNRAAGASPAPIDHFYGWQFKPFYWTSPNITDPAKKAMNRQFNVTSTAGSGVTGTAYLHRDHLKIYVRGAELPAIASDGSVDILASAKYAISYVRLLQKGAPNAAYVGTDGPLNASVKYKTSSNARSIVGTIDVPAAAKPGQIPAYLGGVSFDDFCGGWYSPLMLFFDQARPQFTGSTKFPLAQGTITTWPEKKAPGYFLAMDRNKNNRIDQANELFGNNQAKDGFDALALLDKNKDGVIDSKDPEFKNLVLWRDWGSDSEEMLPLSKMGISSIGVKSEAIIRGYGDRAESRGEAHFVFKNKTGAAEQGLVQDIFFSGR